MELHEQEHPPPKGTTNYYFLDQVSLNQHKFVDDKKVQQTATNPHTVRPDEEDETKMQNQIVGALKAQMIKSGHVLMCLWPLEAPHMAPKATRRWVSRRGRVRAAAAQAGSR